MKLIKIVALLILMNSQVFTQNVSINEDGSAPDASAMLDIQSSNKGVLIPRISYANLPVAPPAGLIIYLASGSGANTNPIYPNLSSPNFYFFNGGYWVKIDNENNWVANNDYVLNSDLIVQSSLGVGSEATTGFYFGFYTIALIDTVPSIYFFDTSNSVSFPTNDWSLQANGVNDGDKDYFAIVDISAGRNPFVVEAPGVNNALYVKGSNIGMGTNDPLKSLHIISGGAPTIRLEQDGSEANTPYIWDLVINNSGLSIVDITNSSSVPFLIEGGAPSNSIVIDENGNIGFGEAVPARSVHISTALRLEPTATAPANPVAGDLYFNSSDNKLKCYDGTQWQDLW